MLFFFTSTGLFLVAAGFAAAFFGLLWTLVSLGMIGAGLILLDLVWIPSLMKFTYYENGRLLANVFGFLALVLTLLIAGLTYENPLHDVTTDVFNPPKITHLVFPFRIDQGGDYLDPSLAIPGDFDAANAREHTANYPHLSPVSVNGTPEAAYEKLEKNLAKQPPNSARTKNEAFASLYKMAPTLKPVLQDEKMHHLEYELEVPILGVISDVALDVRTFAAGTQVPVRVRTRVPLPDLGWGAFVIEDLNERIADLCGLAPPPPAPAAEKPAEKPAEPAPAPPPSNLKSPAGQPHP